MLEDILKMVREFGQQQVVENPAIPNENNEAVMAEASRAVAGTLQKEVASGNTGEIMNLFGNSEEGEIMKSPVAHNMQSGFIENITNKLGIDKNAAAGLAATFIPMILSKLVHRTNSNDPQDSGFNLNSLIEGLSGGTGGHGFGNLLNQFTGNNSGNQGLSMGAGGEEKGGLDSLINNFFGR